MISGHISVEKYNWKIYMHPNVHCSTIFNSEDMEATLMSIDGWLDKDLVYINNEVLVIKKNEIYQHHGWT